MEEHHLETKKTARLFTLGDIEAATEVWIVLHGYAQLASDFIQNFQPLVSSTTAVIAPEGFHRFYRKGFYGDVVASWMTKEDRLNDIEDYLGFLNTVVDRFCSERHQLHILGFSQGVATACRWVADGRVQPYSLTLWAGSFPRDIDLPGGAENIRNTRTFLAYDEADPFRTEESWAKQLDFFKQIGLTPTKYQFSGGHTIPRDEFTRFVETHINPFLSS
ncbi:MAG: phospholipase [Bacteroidia bacterium]|nr:phospholipase [Bacteroidia bacterium]